MIDTNDSEFLSRVEGAELKEKIDRQIVVKKDQTGQSRATIIGE